MEEEWVGALEGDQEEAMEGSLEGDQVGVQDDLHGMHISSWRQ